MPQPHNFTDLAFGVIIFGLGLFGVLSWRYLGREAIRQRELAWNKTVGRLISFLKATPRDVLATQIGFLIGGIIFIIFWLYLIIDSFF